MPKILVFVIVGIVCFAFGVICTLIAFSYGFTVKEDTKDLSWGQFPVTPKLDILPDGRTMRLLDDFVYIDKSGHVWKATKDRIVDGASIPQIFWSVTGGPMAGKFRFASIVHDEYCELKTEPWQKVHRMFYEACRCEGVPEEQAKILFLAVYHRGPRWGSDQGSHLVDYLVTESSKGKTFDYSPMPYLNEDNKAGWAPAMEKTEYKIVTEPANQKRDKLTKKQLEIIENYIKNENPSVDDIMNLNLKELFNNKINKVK